MAFLKHERFHILTKQWRAGFDILLSNSLMNLHRWRDQNVNIRIILLRTEFIFRIENLAYYAFSALGLLNGSLLYDF